MKHITSLRIIKTKKNIQNAFLELRMNTPLEHIKVKDICELALINKTTFYRHYEDVFALSEELEASAISKFIDNFTAIDSMFTKPLTFVRELHNALNTLVQTAQPLFYDRMDVLYDRAEKKLKAYYYSQKLSQKEQICVTFTISGIMRALIELKSSDFDCNELLFGEIATLIKRINEENGEMSD